MTIPKLQQAIELFFPDGSPLPYPIQSPEALTKLMQDHCRNDGGAFEFIANLDIKNDDEFAVAKAMLKADELAYHQDHTNDGPLKLFEKVTGHDFTHPNEIALFKLFFANSLGEWWDGSLVSQESVQKISGAIDKFVNRLLALNVDKEKDLLILETVLTTDRFLDSISSFKSEIKDENQNKMLELFGIWNSLPAYCGEDSPPLKHRKVALKTNMLVAKYGGNELFSAFPIEVGEFAFGVFYELCDIRDDGRVQKTADINRAIKILQNNYLTSGDFFGINDRLSHKLSQDWNKLRTKICKGITKLDPSNDEELALINATLGTHGETGIIGVVPNIMPKRFLAFLGKFNTREAQQRKVLKSILDNKEIMEYLESPEDSDQTIDVAGLNDLRARVRDGEKADAKRKQSAAKKRAKALHMTM